MLNNFISEVRHLLLHSLIGGAVWLLPQCWHFRAFKLLARLHPWLLHPTGSLDQLLRALPSLQPHRRSLALGLALHQIVDRADYYLTRKYGERWLQRNLVVGGAVQPPAQGGPAPMLLTPHYGQGYWALRYFNQQLGLPLAWLYLAPPKGPAPKGHKLATRHGYKRLARIEALAGSPAIATGGSVPLMQQHIRTGQAAILVMPDAPPVPGHNNLAINLLGRPACMPAGALSLAVREQAPVYMYCIALDRHTGQRRLRIQGPYQGRSPQQLAQQFADMLTAAIHQDPCAWYMWPQLDAFLQAQP